MEPLPDIDEHCRRIAASADVVWLALLDVLRRELSRMAPVARVLGCDPAQATPTFTGQPGDAVPGFRVARSNRNQQLVLRGRHRFADYALTFELLDGALWARTQAAFPGVLGRLYRAAVIRTGGHRFATRRMLRRVASAARRRELAFADGSRDPSHA